MSKGKSSFTMVCFTTNKDRFSPLSIMNKFIKNAGYNDIKLINDKGLNFHYKLENKQYNINKLLILIREIINLENTKYEVCSFADSYLIIIDLEKDDTYEQLDIIINFMKNICDLDKTIFVLGVYNDANNTNKDLDEENIIEYLDGKKLIYEYVESNVDSIKDLIKTIDFIIAEGIKKNEKKIFEMEKNNINDSQSKSRCIIY